MGPSRSNRAEWPPNYQHNHKKAALPSCFFDCMLNARAGSASPVLGWPAEFGLGMLGLVLGSWAWATAPDSGLSHWTWARPLGLDRLTELALTHSFCTKLSVRVG